MARSPLVTLNIGSQRVSGALFEVSGKGALFLKKYTFSDLSGDPAAEAAHLPQVNLALAEVLANLGVKKSPVRLTIAGHSVFTRFVKLPAIGGEKIDQIIEFEAQQNVPFPINEVIWDYQTIRETESGEIEVVLVAIKSDALNNLNDIVEGHAVQTECVDVAPTALYNAFRYNYPDDGECHLLLDIGARSSNLIFIDGQSVFTRSVPVGGAAITSAIGKEFELSFNDAEKLKIQSGYVSLGGAYEEDPDPQISAMSKVIRNTLSRLHAEIVRTVSFYCGQQGGRAVQKIHLCGGGASLPYVKEFIEEKLNQPVDYFNPFANLSVDAEVDADDLAGSAHMLGEHVGSALHGKGVAMGIDLQPDALKRRKEIKERKPFLLVAAFCLLLLPIASGIYCLAAKVATEKRLESLQQEVSTLNLYDRKIKAHERKVSQLNDQIRPYIKAVNHRVLWLSLLNDLNQLFENDYLWFTHLELLSAGQNVFEDQGTKKQVRKRSSVRNRKNSRALKGQAKEKKHLDKIRLSGLYRGQHRNEINALYKRLQNFSWFDLEGRPVNEVIIKNEPNDGSRWAAKFMMELPFKTPIDL